LRVTFLGTAASRPTVNRNVSSLIVQREGELMMFDCGEGTQRQMMRFGTGFALRDIFITHIHADHYIGLIGLVRTMGLQDRTEPLDVWTPAGTESTIRNAIELGGDRVPFEVRIHGLSPGDGVGRDVFDIVPFQTSHKGRCLGYAIVEHTRLGRFDPETARALSVPEGPAWGRLHRGEAVEVDGRTVTAQQVVGPPRPGRKLVYTGDTRASAGVRDAAGDADLLIHEATFGAEDSARARSTGHATARDAAALARDAGVHRLALTHFSPRYADDPRALEREAREVFGETVAAHDGMVIEVPYRDE